MLICLAFAIVTAGASARGGPFDFELTKLADGVYVAVRPDPMRQPGEGNSTFIVNEHDVVVVDTGDFTRSAENLIALLRTVTHKPVSVVVNTHWHGDHNHGNAEFARVFPGVEIIGHPSHAALLTHPKVGLASMRDQAKDLEARLPRMRQMVESGLDANGLAIPAHRIAELRGLLEWLPIALPEYSRLKTATATLTVADSLTLHRGARRIEVRWLGLGNTDGDLVVHLPQERIVIAGDLVVHPIPYALGSFPKEWPVTLERLIALDWNVLVPGHGPPLRDRTYLRAVQDAIRAVDAEVLRQHAAGADLETARASLALDPTLVARFSGGDPGREARFMRVFARALALSAYKQASGVPIDQVDIY